LLSLVELRDQVHRPKGFPFLPLDRPLRTFLCGPTGSGLQGVAPGNAQGQGAKAAVLYELTPVHFLIPQQYSATPNILPESTAHNLLC
jgi:hypothetical protein